MTDVPTVSAEVIECDGSPGDSAPASGTLGALNTFANSTEEISLGSQSRYSTHRIGHTLLVDKYPLREFDRSILKEEGTKSNWPSLAEALERHLGDPTLPEVLLSFAQTLGDDESEKFPETLHQAVNDWGLHHFYVPQYLGGRFKSFEALLALIRSVARRDLTAAIAHSATYLGCAAVWMAGTTAQQEALARLVKDGRAVAFGLTERAHGSDILASEVSAERRDGGYVLSGEKWLINNADRSAAMVVYARTRPEGGGRGFSLFLVDKDSLDTAEYTTLPKLKTHGIRGADLGGIVFKDSRLAADSRVGADGDALEVTLKVLQVTRTMCSALSLGAANTALHTAVTFAQSRMLYGQSVLAIPAVQNTLAEAFLDLLVCDGVALAAARGLHVSTGQFSVWSAVVKYFVPVTLEASIGRLAAVVGARHYLREGPEGIFQKIIRDSAIVSLFDGNTAVNLQSIASQLSFLLPAGGWAHRATTSEARKRISTLFDLSKPLPAFDFQGLSLINHGEDDVLSGLLDCRARLIELAEAEPQDSAFRALATLSDEIIATLQDIGDQARTLTTGRGSMLRNSASLDRLAKAFCHCHAASACLQLWMHSQTHLTDGFVRGDWLVPAIERLLRPADFQVSSQMVEQLVQQLMAMHARKEFVSLVPVRFC